MGTLTISWKTRGKYITEQRIYRSATAFTPANLPSVLATIDKDAELYSDATAPNANQFYIVEQVREHGLPSIFSGLITTDTNNGPGPSVLVGGNREMGFYGEIPASQFITRDALSKKFEFTEGTLTNLEDVWLKFALDGKILFVHKNSVRYTISWDQINKYNLIFGSRRFTIGDRQYKIRLLKGADTDPYAGLSSGNDLVGSRNSEWSRLFYPLVIDANIVSYTGPKYASYTNLDLGMVTVNGGYSWCQETVAANVANRVTRGYTGVSSLGTPYASGASASYGWRPCLELV